MMVNVQDFIDRCVKHWSLRSPDDGEALRELLERELTAIRTPPLVRSELLEANLWVIHPYADNDE